MRYSAHAKLNLTLRVGQRRNDGFHNVESLVVFTSLADRLKIFPDNDISLQLRGPFADEMSTSIANSVVQTAYLFAERHDFSSSWRIILEKYIPPAAGLGGGSSDAAAMLKAIVRLYGRLPNAEKDALASSLGSDVPVCFLGRASILRGRGEKIHPVVTPLPELYLLLAKPPGKLSAEAVYQRLDDIRDQEGLKLEENLPDNMNLPILLSWCRERPNHLEPAAISMLPEITVVLKALEMSEDCQLARMSGSGPVCFGIYQTLTKAWRAKKKLAADHPNWWLHVDVLNPAAS